MDNQKKPREESVVIARELIEEGLLVKKKDPLTSLHTYIRLYFVSNQLTSTHMRAFRISI